MNDFIMGLYHTAVLVLLLNVVLNWDQCAFFGINKNSKVLRSKIMRSLLLLLNIGIVALIIAVDWIK